MTATAEPLRLTDVRELRDRLEEQRRSVLDEYEMDLARERAIPADEQGDVADHAEVATDREELFAAAETLFERLQQIDAALLRISEGSYGLCLAGGEPIPLTRLRAIPWATHCAAHQEELESRERRNSRQRESFPARAAV